MRVVVISHARVPLVKFQHVHTHINVDISFNQASSSFPTQSRRDFSKASHSLSSASVAGWNVTVTIGNSERKGGSWRATRSVGFSAFVSTFSMCVFASFSTPA